MTSLVFAYRSLANGLSSLDWLVPTLARFLFVAVLFQYFWASGLTKLGDGIFGFLSPSVGAYAQIFPNAMLEVSYDTSQLSLYHWAVVVLGTVAEFILPILIAIGLLSRVAALGMIGFIVVQSLTDLYGHGAIEHEGTLGAWFDKAQDSLIMDQRALWVFLLLVIVIKGAGPLALDRLFRRASDPMPAEA